MNAKCKPQTFLICLYLAKNPLALLSYSLARGETSPTHCPSANNRYAKDNLSLGSGVAAFEYTKPSASSEKHHSIVFVSAGKMHSSPLSSPPQRILKKAAADFSISIKHTGHNGYSLFCQALFLFSNCSAG